jgi:hypothetical protein
MLKFMPLSNLRADRQDDYVCTTAWSDPGVERNLGGIASRDIPWNDGHIDNKT